MVDLDAFYGNAVEDENGCWLWTGANAGRSYGRYGSHYAHRLSWAIWNGPIPPGLYICHECDVPRCINPGHLFAGTQAENLADMCRKGRASRSPRLQGERNPAARLTAAQVKALLVMRSEGASYSQLMARFGISKSQTARIVQGQAWQSLGRRLAEVLA